jgi:CRISPR-associated protein Cas1
MIGRIVEIADDRRHLSLYRGFMMVKDSENGAELGRIPLDDIAAVIASAHGITYTNNILVALAERGAPFVLCDDHHNVIGMLLALEGNHFQGKRIEAQLAAKLPLNKRLWATVVKSKLEQQAVALSAIGQPSEPLAALARKVKSGDSENAEAQGARRYWSILFGKDFRRDRVAPGANAQLNYGYTVLRSAMARAIVAAGLHPSIELHHCNDSNAMRLADDLMEPFRPMVDLKVWQLQRDGKTDVTPETKRALAHMLYEDMQTTLGATPLIVCQQRLAVSLAQVYLHEQDKLDLPLPNLELSLSGDLAFE